MKNISYLSLGSNVGDREAHLREAVRRLSALGTVGKISSFYETEPVEFTKQPWFLNCAVELDTEKTPQGLMRGLLDIEKQMGRDREASAPKGPRTIDIDILLYGDQIIDEPGLKVPHPAMHQRRFVLAPLAEIDAEVIHPVLERSVGELLDELPADAGKVRKMES
jgi:2-amino-4-hydroxy-6-hydroxymethyldihydropteridine diphosphokinase